MSRCRSGLFSLVAATFGVAGCGTPSDPQPPATLVVAVTGGDHQKGPAGSELPVPLRVTVTRNGSPVVGQTLDWSVPAGQATIVRTTPTDAQGVATAVVRLSEAQLGATGPQTVRATGNGVAADFSLEGLAAATDPVLVGEVPIPPLYGIHDTYVRDGIAFVCAWNSGVIIYDVGDGRRGGSPSHPVEIGRLLTSDDGVPGGPAVHNAWWFHNPVTGQKRYLFVGQEGPATLFTSASGDLHVVDVADPSAPHEVASLRIPGAGVHNFWMDEPKQLLYAAFYNGGVVALDVSGTLSGDLTGRIRAQARPGGAGNTFVWGVMLAGGALWVSDIVSGFWKLDPVTLATQGGGNNVAERWGSDLWVSGAYGYTGTWGGIARGAVFGDAIKVWRVDGPAPVLADSVVVPNVRTISDLEVSDDGKWLVATTERLSGQGLEVYDLANPLRPVLVGSTPVSTGLHTGSLARIGGRLFVFAARNPGEPALQVYDITR